MRKFKVSKEQAKHMILDFYPKQNWFGLPLKSFDNPLTIFDVNEGLVRTLGWKKTLEYVKKYLTFDRPFLEDFVMDIDGQNGKKKIVVLIPIAWQRKRDFVKLAIQAMDLCGWSNISNDKVIQYNGCECMLLDFEQKFYDNIFDVNSQPFLYHITLLRKTNKIKNVGIAPKSTNDEFIYPDRVYLLTTDNDTIVDDLALQLYNARKDKVEADNKYRKKFQYCLLRIDTDKLPKDQNYYEDPLYKYGVFTYGNIPPSAISLVRDINVDELLKSNA